MPEIVKCPECERTLRVPDDLLGKPVRCPSCKATFTAKAQKAAAPDPTIEDEPPRRPRSEEKEPRASDRPSRRERPEDEERARNRPRSRRADEYDDRPRRRREDDHEYDEDEEEVVKRRREPKSGNSQDWVQVRQGLGLILIGIYVFLGGALLNCCGSIVFRGMAGESRDTAADAAGAAGSLLLAIIYLLCAVSGVVLDLVGTIFCIAAPERQGAKTLAKTSTGLKVAGTLVYLLGLVILLTSIGFAVGLSPSGFLKASGAGLAITVVGILLLLAGPLVFLFFLRALATIMRRDGLKQSLFLLIIVNFLWIALFLGGTLFVVLGVASAGPRRSSGSPSDGIFEGMGYLAMMGFCLGVVLATAYLVWYLVTLRQVRTAIFEYLRRR